MGLALNILLSALALIVLADLATGLPKGRLRLLSGDKGTNPTIFWGNVGIEAILVALVASLWL
jgi:hypothetical protein